jgi:hypothetical protein
MTLGLALASLLLVQSAGGAQPAQGNASIDYAAGGGIRDWHADDDRGVYLRDRTNRWYYAAFRHRCPGVVRDQRIAFDTNGFQRFDRLSSVKTATETCAVESLDRSDAPAAKGGKKSD